MLKKIVRFCSCSLVLSLCLVSLLTFTAPVTEEPTTTPDGTEYVIEPFCNLEDAF